MSNSLRPHGLKHARLPCFSPFLRAYSNSCPSSRWCHPTTSSSVTPFSSCPQSFPASSSFPMSQLSASGALRIGASASVLPLNIQGGFPLGLTGLISYCASHLKSLLQHQSFKIPILLFNIKISTIQYSDISGCMYPDFTFSSRHRAPKAFAASWVVGASFVLMGWPWVSPR